MSRIFCDYVNQTRCEPRRGVVVGFPSLAETVLRSMKEELGLSMTVSELHYCQRAYHTPDHGAITLDELYFLDSVANGLHHTKDFISISRLSLSHSEAARTYRDLLEKRTLLAGKPHADAPSLLELSEILSKILARSGKQADLSGASAIADRSEALLAAADGLTPTDTLSVDPSLPSLQLFSGDSLLLHTKQAEEDDAILLLRSPIEEHYGEAEGGLPDSLLLRLSLFAKSQIYKKIVRACRAVDHRGIAIALISLYDGIYTELSAIPSVFDDGELYDLALCEHGSLLVAVPRDAADRFSEEANRYGILSARIARAVKGNRLTVRKNGHAPYSLPVPFLRSFSAHRIPFLLESTAVPQGTPEVIHSIARNADAADLSVQERTPSSSIPSSSIGLCSAAGSRYLSFEHGLNTALLSVLEAVLSGAELSRISVTDTYVYPEKLNSSSLGGLFEAFLGVYRVLAELAIPNRSSFLPFSLHGRRTEGMAVYCSDQSQSIRSEHFTVHGSRVYLVALPKNGGIYNFSAVRSLLSLFSALRKDGRILSATLGLSQAPNEIIKSMSGAYAMQYNASVSESRLDEPLDGIFIVLETSSDIRSLTSIGTVQRVIPSETVTAQPTVGLPSVKPILSQKRVPNPTVVILPSHDSGNLYALAELFKSSGCTVRILPDLTKDTAILENAQIAVLSGRTAEGASLMLSRIKGDLRAMYALRSLIERDGILLAPQSVYEGLSELLGNDIAIGKLDAFHGSGVYLHDGLSKEAAQKTVNFYR